VDIASARLWLLEGIPFCDIVTMLEVRRRFEIPSTLNLARAHEIARTAQRMISRQKIARIHTPRRIMMPLLESSKTARSPHLFASTKRPLRWSISTRPLSMPPPTTS
jgi:hypothetical protein